MAEAATKGTGLAAYVRGTRLLLAVQFALAIAMTALICFGQRELNAIRAERTQAQEELRKAAAAKQAAEKERAEAARRYLDAAPNLRAGYAAFIKAQGGQLDQRERATTFLSNAVNTNPTDPFALSLLAQATEEFGDPREAIARYGKAAEAAVAMSETPSPDDQARQARLMCLTGKSAEADRLAAALPKTSQAAFIDAGKALKLGKWCPSLAAMLKEEPAPGADSYAVARIFLQINTEAARPLAEALRAQLQAKGLEAPGIELVDRAYPHSGQIRYYYEGQREAAEALAQQIAGVGAGAADPALQAWLGQALQPKGLIRKDGTPIYDGLPRDQVEIWLPPLTK